MLPLHGIGDTINYTVVDQVTILYHDKLLNCPFPFLLSP